MPSSEFTVTHRHGAARRGRLRLAHGLVETPAFMPVGTRGAVKGVTADDLDRLGADILLANTYHLHLRPGDDLVARAGGLHAFIGWSRPILTDSGGYQVFSLADRRTLSEAGVVFRSHLDGSRRGLTPESAVDIQTRLGPDVAMMLDECPSWPAPIEAVEAAMTRTLRWARRGRDRFLAVAAGADLDLLRPNRGQVQFGIVQGGTYPTLRARSLEGTLAVGFDGYASGGLSVGEPTELMYGIVGETARLLPADRPRYLMGTGTPDNLVGSQSPGASICLTASCPRGTPGTASSLPPPGPSISKMYATPRTTGRSSRVARVRPAAGIRGPTCAIFFRLARWRPRPSTRCITYTFTLTPCDGLGRLSSSEPSKSSKRGS